MRTMIERFKNARFHLLANKIALSPLMIIMQFLFACLVVYMREEYLGVSLFGYWIAFLLFVCSDLLAILPPTLFLAVFVTHCHNSADKFLSFVIPMASVLVVMLLLHFILYARRPVIGRSFYGLCAVAIATSLSGLGTITAEEVMTPFSLYYIVFLGVGMVVLYLLIQSIFRERKEYDVYGKLITVLYFMGIFAALLICNYYRTWNGTMTNINGQNLGHFDGTLWEYLTVEKKLVYFQAKNNLSTFILFALPCPFYFAVTKNRLHVLSAIFMYVCLAFSGSRGGLLMGTVLFVLCLIYLIIFDRKFRWGWVILSILGIAAGVRGAFFLVEFYDINNLNEIVTGSATRMAILKRSIHNFLDHPIFGIGLTSHANRDLYSPLKGAMSWYHMMIPQIYGSMGIVGIAAWTYHIGIRFSILLHRFNAYKAFIGLSYAGLFLMSQVNPGEFCPIPYGLLAVLLFVFAERKNRSEDLAVALASSNS